MTAILTNSSIDSMTLSRSLKSTKNKMTMKKTLQTSTENYITKTIPETLSNSIFPLKTPQWAKETKSTLENVSTIPSRANTCSKWYQSCLPLSEKAHFKMKRNRVKLSPEWSTLQQKWTSRTRTVKWLPEKSHRTETLHRRIDLINMIAFLKFCIM